MRPLALALALALPLAAACGEDTEAASLPDAPTYFADVQPLLREHCVSCHGAVPVEPKLARFRLDRYVKDDPATFDVWDYAQAAAGPAPLALVAVDREAPAMPPAYALADRHRELLARWLEQGAPKGERENRPPRLELSAPAAATADQSLAVSLRAWDEDHDGLVVQLWAHDPTAGASSDGDVPLGPALGGGMHALALDTGTLPSRSYELYAILDDGFSDDPAQNRTRAALSEVAVDHGARSTAPRVALLSPGGGETLIGSAAISWLATDPDAGDELSINLELVDAAGAATRIAAGLPNTGSYTWAIPSEVPAGVPYLVRVTATDRLGMPANVRADTSDAPVTIARGGATTLSWDDVKPLFVSYCAGCHGQPARSASLESFRLDKYDASDPEPPVNADPGVFETKGAVYQRTIVQKNMPPGGSPQPSQAERDAIAAWIVGGAPRGGGPANARPTFTWIRPSATQTGAPVLLQWSAADAEGLAAGRLEYAKVNGMPAAGCANAAGAAFQPIPDPAASATLSGAPTWAQSFTWTPPATPNGYYCLRGVVTDSANQLTAVINPFGVK